MEVKTLKKLGFKKAAENLEKIKSLEKKLQIAYQNFQWIRPESFGKFNEELRKSTEKRSNYALTYDKLVFTPIDQYGKVPPQDVLDAVEKAANLKCFDKLEVCTIESIEERPDPIIFGVIDGCGDKFFVAQWDNDVKFEDIIQHQKD